MFSDAALNQAVQDTLGTDIPAGHRHAVVAGVDQRGVRIVASLKLDDGDHWRLQGVAEHAWDGENTVGAKLLLSW